MTDFPAAHSMDTEWFAVDADGNLGMFHSQEAGAVPKNSNRWLDFGGFIDRLIEQLPKDERDIINLDIDGSLFARDATLESLLENIYSPKDINLYFIERDYFQTFYETLLVLASEEAIDELEYDLCFRFAGEEIVVWIDSCPSEIIKKLIQEGKIIKGKSDLDLLFENAFVFGIYVYSHGYGCPAPYIRLQVPINCLKFDNLADSLQEYIKPIYFNSIRFIEAREIQPIEQVECDTWGSDDYWLDTKREREEWKDVDEEDFAEYG